VVKVEKFLLFLLQGISESSGVVALSLALAKAPLRWRRIIAGGTILAVFIFIVRTFSFTFGLHTVAALLLTVILITSTTRLPPTKAFVVVSISVIILGVLERIIIFEILFPLGKLEPQIVTSNYLLWKLMGLPQAAIMIFLALLIPRFMIPEQEQTGQTDRAKSTGNLSCSGWKKKVVGICWKINEDNVKNGKIICRYIKKYCIDMQRYSKRW
jgi:hypothetical protein